MPARLLLFFSLFQVGLIYLPLPTWTLWMLHFATLEGCLLATATGLGAAGLVEGTPLRVVALLSALLGALPALAVVPTWLREGQPFSPLDWLTGGSVAAVQVQRDLSLLPGLSADLYRAPGAGPHPFVVIVHGGSWRSGDKGDVVHVSQALALEGISVVDVQYRLSGEAPFPAAISDVKGWLVALRSAAGPLDLDPERAAILGRSAGAEIVLVSAWSDMRIPTRTPPDGVGIEPVRLRAVVSIYGPTDLPWAHDNPFIPDVVRGPEAQEQYLGGPPERSPENWRLATPMTWVEPGRPLPPTLILHGTGERCVRPSNAEKLEASLRGAGQSVKLLLIPFADHGFDVRRGGFGEQLSRGVLIDFLHETLLESAPLR